MEKLLHVKRMTGLWKLQCSAAMIGKGSFGPEADHENVRASVGFVPQPVNSTADPCCDFHRWPLSPLRDGINFLANAAFFVLRAHAARKSNSQVGAQSGH